MKKILVRYQKIIKAQSGVKITADSKNALRTPKQDVKNISTYVAPKEVRKKYISKEDFAIEQEKARKETQREDEYYDPETEFGIHSGNFHLDKVYDNQWLLDVPILRQVAQTAAKHLASISKGMPSINSDAAFDPFSYVIKPNYNGNKYKVPGDAATAAKDSHLKDTGRASLLDQYFSSAPLLRESTHKPTSDYLEFLPSYSMKSKTFDKDFYSEDSKAPEEFRKSLESLFGGKVGGEGASAEYAKFLSGKKTVFDSPTVVSTLSKLLGADLSDHKIGAAWDQERELPYISISDAWDFSPKDYKGKWPGKSVAQNDAATIQAALMHKVGNPFKVYDRFYFDPKTGEYIPEKRKRLSSRVTRYAKQ